MKCLHAANLCIGREKILSYEANISVFFMSQLKTFFANIYFSLILALYFYSCYLYRAFYQISSWGKDYCSLILTVLTVQGTLGRGNIIPYYCPVFDIHFYLKYFMILINFIDL